MTRITCWLAACTAVGLLMTASPVAAQAERFNLRADFTAATTLTTRSFEDLPDEAEYTSFSYGDVTFRSTDGDLADLKVFSPLSLPRPMVQSLTLFSNRNFNPMVVEFATPISAFGTDVVAIGDAGAVPDVAAVVVTAEKTDGTSESFNLSLASGGPSFIGLVTRSGAFSRITISNAADQFHYLGVDDVSYGHAPQAPAGGSIDEKLLALLACIRAGREDRSIRGIGPTLEARVRLAQTALKYRRPKLAGKALDELSRKVSKARGRKITAERADLILGLATECRSLLPPT